MVEDAENGLSCAPALSQFLLSTMPATMMTVYIRNLGSSLSFFSYILSLFPADHDVCRAFISLASEVRLCKYVVYTNTTEDMIEMKSFLFWPLSEVPFGKK